MKKACCILLASVLCLLTLAGCATPSKCQATTSQSVSFHFNTEVFLYHYPCEWKRSHNYSKQ